MVLRRVLIRVAGPLSPVAAAAVVAFTGLRLSGRTVRWSSSAVGFTPAIAVGSGLLAVAAARLSHPRSAGVLGATSAALAVVVAPRARVAASPPAAPGTAHTLQILSANCLKGRADADALVALVREVGPDVLAIQEQNPRFIGRLEAAGLFDLLPHRVLGAGGRLSDAGLLSRFPLEPIAPELPSEFVAARATLPDGQLLPLISFHPIPPVGQSYTEHWVESTAAIPSPSGTFDGGIVAGDFNATLDHPQLRAVLASGWRDAGAERGGGLRSTWSEFGLLRLTIDHILAPPGARVADYRVHRIVGSDHRAISASITLT